MTQAALSPSPQASALSGPALGRLIALLLPIALLGGAIGSQYLGGLIPCEMCVWQRWPHAAAILFAIIAFSGPIGGSRARTFTLLAAAAIAISGAIGVYHAGVELGIFQGMTTCTASGAMSLQEIMKVPLVRCDQIQFAFLGVSMAGWNAILSLSGASLIAALVLRRVRA